MKLDFKNKIVLLTGGEGGLGKAICNKFIQFGAKVIVTTTKKNLEIKKNNKKKYMYLDFNNKNSVHNFFSNLKKVKKIDVLINNAGINQLSYINEIDEKYLEEIYKVNLKGPILMTKQISKIMMKKKSGKIINVSSIFGVVSKSCRSLYSTTKYALSVFSHNMAMEYGKFGLIFKVILLGLFKGGLKNKLSKKSLIYELYLKTLLREILIFYMIN